MKGAIMLSGGGSGKLFAAIGVTFPANATLTCTNGTKTLTAKTTSGQWVFAIPEAGTWTVTATQGTNSKSQSVEITAEGQNVSVKLAYEFVLFDNGVVDGISWDLHSASNRGSNDTSTVDDKIRINYQNRVGWSAGSASYETDLTEYKALKLLGKVNWENTEASYPAYIGVTDTAPKSAGSDTSTAIPEEQRLVQTKLTTTEDTYSVDISAIDGVHRVIFGGTDNAEASRIWLE